LCFVTVQNRILFTYLYIKWLTEILYEVTICVK